MERKERPKYTPFSSCFILIFILSTLTLSPQKPINWRANCVRLGAVSEKARKLREKVYSSLQCPVQTEEQQRRRERQQQQQHQFGNSETTLNKQTPNRTRKLTARATTAATSLAPWEHYGENLQKKRQQNADRHSLSTQERPESLVRKSERITELSSHANDTKSKSQRRRRRWRQRRETTRIFENSRTRGKEVNEN